MAELRHRALQQLRDTVNLAQIGGQAEKTTAQRRDALNSFRRFNNIDTHDIATGFRQAHRHALAQTRITAAHHGHFALQGECVENHTWFLYLSEPV